MCHIYKYSKVCDDVPQLFKSIGRCVTDLRYSKVRDAVSHIFLILCGDMLHV
jgi:hypothetical protein